MPRKGTEESPTLWFGVTGIREGENVKDFLPELLKDIPDLAPSFFFVDPYSHPLTVPILNNILMRPRTEALVTFMYYRINMDAGNQRRQHLLDEMFDSDNWRKQPFLQQHGRERDLDFLEYFKAQITAKYKLDFRIRYDPEDGVRGDRTKYYLIHASNHPRAVLLMKQIMWPLGDEEGLFDYSGRRQGGVLFSSSPKEEELKEFLTQNYTGKQIGYEQLREDTWYLPFIDKHYRSVIGQLKKEGKVDVQAVTSKTPRGLQGNDRISFYPLGDQNNE